jgi:nickel-dependent lactate racemase
MCAAMVVGETALAGLFIDTPEAAWEAAAEFSGKLHIIYKDRPFKKVLACAPPMYEDIWTGGKCMYKLEPVVADGGELIIYAPHIREVSVTHGKTIEKIGYHVRDYFLKQPGRFAGIPGGVKAHSTHVKGIGFYENGKESSRISVSLATQIPESVCHALNLGYRDPRSIHLHDFQNREDEGILFVEKAGEILYRLKNDPFL